MRTTRTTALFSLGALLFTGAAQAADIKPADRPQMAGDKLFEYHGCVNCHGAQGKNPITKKVPAIGGKEEAFIYKEATDILAGKRTSEEAKLMHSALSYHASCDAPPNDAELKKIAAWLSKQ
jgi:cytochrome c553